MKDSMSETIHPVGVEITFYKSDNRDAARYVSGTTVREEALEHGRPIGLYWSATGQVQRENVVSKLPGMDSLFKPIHVFELEIDGQLLQNHWQVVSTGERPGARPGTVEAVVELRHELRPIDVKVVTRLDSSPILVRWLEITNTGSAPAAISHVTPWSGVIWNTPANYNPSVDRTGQSRYTLGYIPREFWGQEGHFCWQEIPRDTYKIERTMGRSHGSPYFILKNEITGEMAFAALEWSGNWSAEFSNRFEDCLSFKMGPLGPAPLRVVEPGETVKSPAVHLGLLHCDMDKAVEAWYEHVRRSVIPPRPEGKEMFTVAGRVVEEPGEWMLKEVDIAAEMGVEAFMVDAGWYGEEFSNWWEQCGDWFEGSWLPGGLANIRKHVHSKGMQFGLWMEAETVAKKSRLHREHPEWVMTTDDNRQAGEMALDLAKPEVARFVDESVQKVIGGFELDIYKMDFNVSTFEGGQNMHAGFAEHSAWRYYEALYGMYDRVRAEFPNVVLENCGSGGGRNDLAMMSRFHYACESDLSTFPYGIRTINTMTMFLPPEAICYYHNHIEHAHQTADMDTHLRVTLFATPIFVGFGGQNADRSTAYFDKTKRYIELGKTFCRRIMANHPMVYHHTPDIGVLSPADWCVLEYAMPDRSSGYAGIFRLSGSGDPEYIFRPRGVDLSRDYNVTLDNICQTFTISGRELFNDGLKIRLEMALTSELVMYTAV